MFQLFCAGRSDLRFSGHFYGIIIIHDIPYLIAKNATTLIPMLFMSPDGSVFYSPRHMAVLWIWATLYQPERGWGMQHKANTAPDEPEKRPIYNSFAND